MTTVVGAIKELTAKIEEKLDELNAKAEKRAERPVLRVFLALFASSLVACQAPNPTTSSEADAAKAVTQEFPCEAAILDTVVRAVRIDTSEVIGEYSTPLKYFEEDWGGFFNYDGKGMYYSPPVEVYRNL